MTQYSHISDPALLASLQDGAVGVLPCDTVYGLVCRAEAPDSVARLYAAKHRVHKPGTLIAADVDQLVVLGIKKRYLSAVAHYWPAALSVVLPCGPELEYLHQGVGSLAVRIPDSATLRSLLAETGPLLTSSANVPGQPPAVTLQEAMDAFGDTLDFYVDGGDYSQHLPSTVIRVIDDEIELLRPGAFDVQLMPPEHARMAPETRP